MGFLDHKPSLLFCLTCGGCDNRLWDEFNPLMQSAVAILSELEYIPLNEKLCNAYGKLDIQYTTDGYSLNRAVYALIEQELRLH